MKYITRFLEEKIKIKPLGQVTTKPHESEWGSYDGEEVLIDGEYTGIIVYYIDYINWLER